MKFVVAAVVVLVAATLVAPPKAAESPVQTGAASCRFVELAPDADGKVRIAVVRAEKYEAQARLVIFPRQRKDDSSPSPGLDMSMQEAILSSGIIARRAGEKLKSVKLDSPPMATEIDSFIADGLKVTREKNPLTGAPANLFTISFVGAGREDCAKVLTAVIEAYRDYLQSEGSPSRETLEIVIKGLQLAQEQLGRVKDDLRRIVQSRREIVPPIDTVKQRLAPQEAAREKLRAEQGLIEWRLQMVKKIKDPELLESLFGLGTPSAGLLADARASADALSDLRKQEGSLLQRVGLEHPDVIAVRVRSKVLEKALWAKDGKAERTDPVEAYKRALEALAQANNNRLDEINKELVEDQIKVYKNAELEAQETELLARIEELRKRVVQFEDRKNQLELEQAAPVLQSRVLNPPRTSGAKVGRSVARVELSQIKDFAISTPGGAPVSKEEALKTLQKGSLVLVCGDRQAVPANLLKLLKDDALVLASPEFIDDPMR